MFKKLILSTLVVCSLPSLVMGASVVRLGSKGVMQSAQVTQLGTAINACWAPPLAAIEAVQINRGTGANLSKIYVTIHGTTTLTDQQVLDKLAANERVVAGKKTKHVVYDCEITGGTRITAITNVVAAFWSGSFADFRMMHVKRKNGTITVLHTHGRVVLSDAEALVEAATQDVDPIE